MGDEEKKFGIVSWVDLTIPDADKIRDFYGSVVGWNSAPVKMGDYDDYCMIAPGTEDPMAGICNARGVNADLPAQWMMYITVENLDNSVAECEKLGGSVLLGPKDMGAEGRYCVIKDPAGAVCALWEAKG